MKHYGDITQIHASAVPTVDVIIGGSPCQDLSVAGKQAGIQGERSGLFMEQLRIIKEMRELTNGEKPKYMVWENVPGAFSSNKGADFQTVLEEIIKVVESEAPPIPIPRHGWPSAGCITGMDRRWSIAWRVFDAQFWGVPQRRKRIALVADFRGSSAPEILFERKGVSGDTEPSGEEEHNPAGAVADGTGESVGAICIQGNSIDRSLKAGCNGKGFTEEVSYTLNTVDRPAVVYAIDRPAFNQGVNAQYKPQITDDGISATLVAKGPSAVAIFCPGEVSRVGERFYWEGEPAPTLRSQPGDNRPAILLENHPADSRVKISDDNVVQTLSARMGTGGGNTPLVMQSPPPPDSGNDWELHDNRHGRNVQHLNGEGFQKPEDYMREED
jgi:DNA (cytosine-5)-methyltransferase 1